ncbi:XdhC family protein [Sagittula sp. SSi028]|uniref:XdhC family protein n=1 Tax=Sagittula sp. SSi028 TaxID=3400636 RepID=UPI003AF9A2CB
MTYVDILNTDMRALADDLRAREEAFAIATIVRTAGTTSAKPGAKAILNAQGDILSGFLGGGCARGAVRRAALQSFDSGAPCLISVTPEERLTENGLTPGAERDGVTYARNGCPSRGTIDIFIEPILQMPELAVVGASPVAKALAELAPRFQWSVVDAPGPAGQSRRLRAVVIATQGQGDLPALKDALTSSAESVSFVGSQKKYAALSEKLIADGIAADRVASVSAPAGLDIGAVTPEEIALSILAELIQIRRRQTRGPHDPE